VLILLDYIQLGILIATFLTSIGTFCAVLVAFKAMSADHARRKKQSTLEFYHQISNERGIPLRELISEKYGNNRHPIQITDEEYKNNKQEFDNQVRIYVRNMDKMAVGIESGVYDFDIFYRLSGKATIILYERIENLIKERYNNGTDRFFGNEFRLLYEKLKQQTDKEHIKNVTPLKP